MAAKSANIFVRLEPDVKEEAEKILDILGISASSAIDIFYRQIILQRGLPFDVKIPIEKPVAMGVLSEKELNDELEKGYANMLEGRVKSADKVFADIRRDYGI